MSVCMVVHVNKKFFMKSNLKAICEQVVPETRQLIKKKIDIDTLIKQ